MAELNLDLLVKEPLDVTFEGKVYKVADPGMTPIIRATQACLKLEKQIEKNPTKADTAMVEFTKIMHEIAPIIPEKVFAKFTIELMTELFTAVFKHFRGDAGPLVQNRQQRRAKASPKKKAKPKKRKR